MPRTPGSFSRRTAYAGAVLLSTFALWAPVASAQTGFTLTLVARECAQFSDIMANRARNNIQESLQDLGKNTVYIDGQPISPAVEDPNNPACSPMAVPWTFTLGRSIAGQNIGTWGRLSYVGGVFRSVTTTLAGVPELGPAGTPTGATIPSAVTIELTPAELQQTSSRLWVQGGVPGQPLNGLQDTYAFGALRCAVDNLNGDNVEWNGFASGSRHIFCYAYYVKPPPTSGTIVVRKNNLGNVRADFVFRGNLSYTPDPEHPGDATFNYFTLSPGAGGSAATTFFRAAGSTWNVREDVPAGWQLAAASCVGNGASTITTNGPGDFSIALAAADVVTCTFDDDIDPPTAGLTVLKASSDGSPENGLNAVDTFGISVTGPGTSLTGSATTVEEGAPVQGLAAPALAVGTTYTISETWPIDNPLGTWGLDPVEPAYCTTVVNGVDTAIPVTPVATATGASFTLQMPATPTVCGFNNRLTYSAQLQVGKLAVNAPGVFAFEVARLDDPVFDFPVIIDASKFGFPVYAPPSPGLPWGSYRILETSGNAGDWMLTRVQCYDQPVPPTGQAEVPPIIDVPFPPQGYVDVTLASTRPFVRCLFTNRADHPPPPAAPVPVLFGGAAGALAIVVGALGAVALARRRGGTRPPMR